MSPVHDTVLGANSASMTWYCFGTNSFLSPLLQEPHEIASRMRTSVLIASRCRLAARLLAAHNFDNFRFTFNVMKSRDPVLQ